VPIGGGRSFRHSPGVAEPRHFKRAFTIVLNRTFQNPTNGAAPKPAWVAVAEGSEAPDGCLLRSSSRIRSHELGASPFERREQGAYGVLVLVASAVHKESGRAVDAALQPAVEIFTDAARVHVPP